MRTRHAGFTLIEVMITVAIIGILAAIAYPNYMDYVRRGSIPEGLAALSDGRVKMEQFFMDNRNFVGACAQVYPPSTTPPRPMRAGKFEMTCASVAANPGATPPVPASYTLTATGTGIVNNFVYTLTNSGIKATTSTGVWSRSNPSCWVLKSDGSC